MLRSMKRIAIRIVLPLCAASLLSATAAFGAAPVLTVPSARTVSEGAHLGFTVSATDADGQTCMLFASNLPGDATFTDNQNNTGSFSWTPNFFDAGFYVVFFMADDTFGGTDNESVQIEVVNANNPPELNAIGDRSIDPGAMQFVMITGSDADDDPLTLGVSGLPAWASFTDYGNGSGSLVLAPPPPTPPGVHTMTATLSDGNATDSETFTVTVTGSVPQNPPVLSAIGAQTVAEGATKQVSLSASDPDGGVLTWSVSLPGFANLTPTSSGSGTATARLDLAPGYCQAGSYSAMIAISDGGFQDTESFTITVTNSNRSPVWGSASYATSLPEGGSNQVSVSASDPDQACGLAAPALSLTGNDGGSALTASLADNGNGAGTLSLTASSTGAGVYHVTLRASDGTAGANVTVTATVTDVVPPLLARAWSEMDPIRLHTGKPTEWVYLEPVGGSFSLEAVNLASVKLYAWEGSGSVPYIQPLPESFDRTRDRDGNGVLELRMDFAKEDLRALFSNLEERVAGHLTLKAQQTGGADITVDLNVGLYPEPKKVIRRVGPNPLNPQAVITIAMPAGGGRLLVRVFDLNGRLVRTVHDSPYEPAGDRDVYFNGKDDRGMQLASGRYFVYVQTPSTREADPITILK